MLPDGLVSTQWPSVRRRCEAMGVRFDQWQADLVRGALGKDARGKYAATVGGCVWSIPRQVGKTFTVGSMLFALCAEIPDLLVLWTAHRTRTSGETFLSMQGMARRPRVAPYVEQVLKGAGTQAVVFRNGSRILFGARDEGFGLGFAGVDVIVFDEAQRLTDQTRMDMVPAANRPHNPAGSLIFYIGTPPRPTDRGDGFAELRADALSGKTGDMFFVELSADANADPDDRTQWQKANPSYPTHTPLESMLRMRRHLGSDDAWRREALGIWDIAQTAGVIPAGSWQDQTDHGEQPLTIIESPALGVEVGPDLAWASITMAGQREDGSWMIELVEDQHTKGRGVAWLVAEVEKALKDQAADSAKPDIRAVVADVASPISTLLEQRGKRWFFKGSEVEVVPLKVAELGQGCTNLLDGIVTGWLWHIDQPQLSTAALSAGKRPLSDTGMWVWSRKAAESDITPIQAATYALIGAQMDRPRKPLRSESSSSGRVFMMK